MQDLSLCEKFNIQQNKWEFIQRMNIPRNGASCCVFDGAIFIFGGNSNSSGSLDSIERYSIKDDIWQVMRLRLKIPVHDTICYNLGGARVLIFGGSSNDKENNKFDIYDLTCELMNPKDN
jgi:N-acetylneuraminic acid mutarotase